MARPRPGPRQARARRRARRADRDDAGGRQAGPRPTPWPAGCATPPVGCATVDRPPERRPTGRIGTAGSPTCARAVRRRGWRGPTPVPRDEPVGSRAARAPSSSSCCAGSTSPASSAQPRGDHDRERTRLADRVLAAPAAGRGKADLPLVGAGAAGFGPRPVDPATVERPRAAPGGRACCSPTTSSRSAPTRCADVVAAAVAATLPARRRPGRRRRGCASDLARPRPSRGRPAALRRGGRRPARRPARPHLDPALLRDTAASRGPSGCASGASATSCPPAWTSPTPYAAGAGARPFVRIVTDLDRLPEQLGRTPAAAGAGARRRPGRAGPADRRRRRPPGPGRTSGPR